MPWFFQRILLACSLLSCLAMQAVYGQAMQGQTFDAGDNKPLEQVVITNVYTEIAKITDKQGKFMIMADAGHLIEFRKEGYKVLRVRVPQGKLPPFFKVVMEKYDPAIPHFENGASPDYKSDSLKYALLYKKELEFPELTGLDAVKHPFSAMSKRNQQVWAFQKEFTAYQQEKYIDYKFNDKLIYTLTGLSGDSLQMYKQLFRPTYVQLRSGNDYMFYNYIKRTVILFRHKGIRAKQSPTRISR